MSTRNKLLTAAAGLLLLALGILLRHPALPAPAISAGSAERSRSAHREDREAVSPPRPKLPRRAKDFQTFVRLGSNGEFPKLTPQEIENYLRTRNRSAESLLTAFRMSQDKAFLTEALEKFPNNPQVLFTALQLSEDPAKRLSLLESLKRADPDNGVANCLAARCLINLGKNDEAVAELLKCSGKPIKDFTTDFFQNAEEAYLSAGFSPVEAKMAGLYSTPKPMLFQMAHWKNLDEIRRNYESSGNVAGVQSLRDIQSELGRSLQGTGLIVDSAVGIMYEKYAWKGIDTPESAAYLQELEQRKNTMNEGAKKITALMGTSSIPEGEWLLYFDRAKLFGEKAANDWMLEKHPEL
ncbi:MAG: hypothetical protein V4584_15900 [Verrucomicrobiota bacterium]